MYAPYELTDCLESAAIPRHTLGDDTLIRSTYVVDGLLLVIHLVDNQVGVLRDVDDACDTKFRYMPHLSGFHIIQEKAQT